MLMSACGRGAYVGFWRTRAGAASISDVRFGDAARVGFGRNPAVKSGFAWLPGRAMSGHRFSARKLTFRFAPISAIRTTVRTSQKRSYAHAE